jgi:hypothetical protein
VNVAKTYEQKRFLDDFNGGRDFSDGK